MSPPAPAADPGPDPAPDPGSGGRNGRKAPSLRLRLGLWLGGAITLAWLGAAAWSLVALSQSIHRDFDLRLKAAAERLMPLAVVQIFEREDDGTAQIIAGFGHDEEAARLAYAVQDREGRILLASRGYPQAAVPPPGATGWSEAEGMRRYSLSALSGSLTMTTFEPLDLRRRAMWSAGLRLMAPLAMLLPVGLLLIGLILRRELAAVARLNARIARRGRGDLTALPLDGLPRELAGIGAAVNALMARLDAALTAERRFAAHAAHELRTPIAAALAQAQRLQAEAGPGPAAERAAQIAASLGRLARLSEKLLQLSRAEGGSVRTGDERDLTAAARLVIDEVARGHDAERLQVTIPQGGLRAPLNPDAYAILLRNLVENALAHATPGTPVAVELGPDGAITVRNDADPVAPDLLARLTEPFARGQSRADGTGLGLSIARAIATAAGGRLELASPLPGQARGFLARFRAPES